MKVDMNGTVKFVGRMFSSTLTRLLRESTLNRPLPTPLKFLLSRQPLLWSILS